MRFSFSPLIAEGKSGYFFFCSLLKKLAASDFYDRDAQTVLVNVSIPISELFRLWVQRKNILIRLDGSYSDRIDHLELSDHYFFRNLGRHCSRYIFLNWIFNFLFENWKVELRLVFCSAIIYQTEFSKASHRHFLFARNKKSAVIPNAYPESIWPERQSASKRKKILITLGSQRRKNDGLAIRHAIRYAVENKMVLKLINFRPDEMHEASTLVERAVKENVVELHRGYKNLEDYAKMSADCQFFVFLSYRDPCPNILLETIAFGLLPITIASGGIPEMLPKNYPVVNYQDDYGFYSPMRYSVRFPSIEFDEFKQVFDAVRKLPKGAAYLDALSMDATVAKYEKFLVDFGSQTSTLR